MQLRRPELSDKAAVIEMMKEFEMSQSAHDGGFWDVDNFDYEDWLESNRLSEMGINVMCLLTLFQPFSLCLFLMMAGL